MSTTYTVRQALRIPVHCPFYFICDGALVTGRVWDLSEAGFRVTSNRPVPIGFNQRTFLTLGDGQASHHLVIESAIVRWTDGCNAGWEIQQMDEVTHTLLTDFLEQDEPEILGVLEGTDVPLAFV